MSYFLSHTSYLWPVFFVLEAFPSFDEVARVVHHWRSFHGTLFYRSILCCLILCYFALLYLLFFFAVLFFSSYLRPPPATNRPVTNTGLIIQFIPCSTQHLLIQVRTSRHKIISFFPASVSCTFSAFSCCPLPVCTPCLDEPFYPASIVLEAVTSALVCIKLMHRAYSPCPTRPRVYSALLCLSSLTKNV